MAKRGRAGVNKGIIKVIDQVDAERRCGSSVGITNMATPILIKRSINCRPVQKTENCWSALSRRSLVLNMLEREPQRQRGALISPKNDDYENTRLYAACASSVRIVAGKPYIYSMSNKYVDGTGPAHGR